MRQDVLIANVSSSKVLRENTKRRMDTIKDRMTGGRMVKNDNRNRGSEEMDNSANLIARYGNVWFNHNQNSSRHSKAKHHALEKRTPLCVQMPSGSSLARLLLNNVRPVSAIVAQATPGNVLMSSQENLLLLRIHISRDAVPLTVPDDTSICENEKRYSSSGSGADISDVPRTPRLSPLEMSLRVERSPLPSLIDAHEEVNKFENILPEMPSRMDCVPSLTTHGEFPKYENIPVPGIIPLSRATLLQSPPSSPDSVSFDSRLSCLKTKSDIEFIISSECRLKQSGFYYEDISAPEAKELLHTTQVGTFLVRISSQTSHFFALSVKTIRGTTSIRIAYNRGSFRLDSDLDSIAKMPAFNCVVALIEYYVVQSASDARNRCVFLESNGRRDTPVILTRPLKKQPQSLRHICRRTIHYHRSPTQFEQLLHRHSASVQVREYLNSYPYAL